MGHGRGEIATRLGHSFARVVLVATVCCCLLLLLLTQVAGSVWQMRRNESAIRGGLALAVAIREQYVHAAHTIVVADLSHVEHYADWVRDVHSRAEELRSQVPVADHWRLERIERTSEEMDAVFREAIVPAVLGHDGARLRAAHARLEEGATLSAADADAVAREAEAMMASEHVETTHVTYLAAAIAMIGILSLITLAITSTRKLRQAVIGPLSVLSDTARRVGAGDFSARVSVQAEGELGLVAQAFDRMAEELLQRERRLVTTERMAAIGQLAAGVAHEINNPIAVIRGYLRTMIPEADGQELRKELQILDEEASACQRIAEDLLAYARSPELEKTPLDVAVLLTDTAERFETSGESKGHPITVQADPLDLELDPVRMRQVLQNLLRNATQASPLGSSVELRGELTPHRYLIRVLDRGGGIPKELGPRIFEPFLSGRRNGTGLGLAVCDGIIRAHGGTIDASERPGGGAEFLVSLPRTDRVELEKHG